MKHFIFGYGSLICPQSRVITSPTLHNVVAEPVVIHHIERTWSARVTRKQATSQSGRDHIEGWTPMGVRMRYGANCNGVLIHVDEEELMRFDVREAGYERYRIDLANIHPHLDTDSLIDKRLPLWPSTSQHKPYTASSDVMSLALKDVQCFECRRVLEMGFELRRRRYDKSSPNDNDIQRDDNESLSVNDDEESSNMSVWVYIQSKDLPANKHYPITQSYLDIIMRGCLSISPDFARRFLETTQGWWHDEQAKQGDDGKCTSEERATSLNESTIAPVALDEKETTVNDHHTWVNDRRSPMYVRADSEYSLENGDDIDKLIEEHHPHALKRRVTSL
eukprot:scaffold4343_cov195-Alexandrium_tamarense.AAC.22